MSKTKVLIIESERGWGKKVEDTKEFDSLEEAISFCKQYNNKYNPPRTYTPDWYMYADIEGREEIGMLR